MRINSSAASNPDVTDRAARQLGVVSVTGTPDVNVTDRAARLLGEVSPLLSGAGTSTATVTNPAGGTTLVTSGALAAGTYEFKLVIASDTATSPGNSFSLLQRTAGDAGTVTQFDPAWTVNSTITFTFTLTLAVNELVKFGSFIAAFTGKVSAMFSWKRLL